MKNGCRMEQRHEYPTMLSSVPVTAPHVVHVCILIVAMWVLLGYFVVSNARLRGRLRAERVYGRCQACEISWRHGDHHTTYHSESEGVFVLCEPCWAALTPEERLPYYREVVFKVWGNRQHLWPAIREAVLKEKS